MEKDDSLDKPLKKLAELDAKTSLRNTTTKRELDTKGSERHFDRQEKWKDNINSIRIGLMWFGGLALIIFVFLIFVAGIYPSKLPQSGGVKALEDLFIIMVSNSKIIILLIIGYFFRDYAGEMYDKVRGR